MKHVFAMNLIDKIFLKTWNSKNIENVLYFTNRCFHLNIANVDYLVSLSIGSTNNNHIGNFKNIDNKHFTPSNMFGIPQIYIPMRIRMI